MFMDLIGILFQFQTDGVDAISLTAFFFGAVVEDVAEMRAAIFADYLGSRHPMTRIFFQLDIFKISRFTLSLSNGFGKTRPAGAGVELRVR